MGGRTALGRSHGTCHTVQRVARHRSATRRSQSTSGLWCRVVVNDGRRAQAVAEHWPPCCPRRFRRWLPRRPCCRASRARSPTAWASSAR
eukprot:2736215-Prymnesium_polylepis.1